MLYSCSVPRPRDTLPVRSWVLHHLLTLESNKHNHNWNYILCWPFLIILVFSIYSLTETPTLVTLTKTTTQKRRNTAVKESIPSRKSNQRRSNVKQILTSSSSVDSTSSCVKQKSPAPFSGTLSSSCVKPITDKVSIKKINLYRFRIRGKKFTNFWILIGRNNSWNKEKQLDFTKKILVYWKIIKKIINQCLNFIYSHMWQRYFSHLSTVPHIIKSHSTERAKAYPLFT